MEKELTCTGCSQQYRETNVPRLLPQCGHTFCQSCIKKRMKQKGDRVKVVCPEDKQDMSFDDDDINNFPKNIALIKLLESKRKDKSFNDSSLNESNIVKHNNNEVDEEDKELITAINESTKGTDNNPYNRSVEGLDLDLEDMCLIHQKPLEIICIRDRTKICSTCAIFGDHKGHEFKSLEEVAKDKEKRCDEILHLIDRKEGVDKKITGKQTKETLLKTLKSNQEGLCKEIKDRFARISDNVKATEKRALDKVTKCFAAIEDKLKEDIRIPESEHRKYLRWQKRAYHEIESFDGADNLIEQLKLLNYDRSADQSDVIEQGERIIAEIQNCMTSLYQHRVESLDSVTLEFNPQTEAKLGEFVVVKEVKKTSPKTNFPQKDGTEMGKFKEVYEQAGITPHKRSVTQIQREQPNNVVTKISMPELNQHYYREDQLMEPRQDQIQEEEEPFVVQVREEPRYSLREEGALRPSLTIVPTTPPSQQFIMNSPQESSRKMNSGGLRDSSFTFQKTGSKKKPKIKLPEKYEKILDGILNDQLQTVDFTNAQLGDQTMIQIVECIRGKKIKTLKLIRNKLTDEGVEKMFPYFSGVITLNLSQNLLTDRFIDRVIDFLPRLPSLKSLILSQNRIKQRNVKARLDDIKKYEIVVSL